MPRFRDRRTFLFAVALFAAAVLVFVGIFRLGGRKYAELELDEEYFFLVRDCTSATAGAVSGQVYLSGGAGYLLGDDAVVLSCYFTREDAEFVLETVCAKGVDARVEERSPALVALEGDRAALKERIAESASTADDCARLLFDTANGLERASLSQEEARAAVRGVSASLKGLVSLNGEPAFARWNAALSSAERRGREIASGILFAKDVRYLQVELCLAVTEISDYFA